MNNRLTDKYFGIPIDEWIERTPNDLEMDAIGLWQLIPVGRDGFGLDGEMLVEFVRKSIIAILRRGAKPVRPSEVEGKYWDVQYRYLGTPEEIAELILKDWTEAGQDPTEEDLWFALM